ncbi:MAG: Na+/H+ antiporter NhaA [Deltaproteobacteria bacterium]|nr:Na+/H+ antiporter NhaA [Deltaproteobacteria bacterium]
MTEPSRSTAMFNRFFHSEVSGSFVLMACTIVALVWANSPWSQSYADFTHIEVGFSWGGASLYMSLQHWINDALMAIFFFVVGLEVKREISIGQLSTLRKAALPVSAAVGGMLIPAAFYYAMNAGGPAAQGWGIPMATDIAFALGLLALFGSRAPIGLKVFLTALAIADDIGAVLVIAFFYTASLKFGALAVAGVFMLLIVGARAVGIRRSGIYLLLAVGVWLSVLTSGLHATIAGILVAMLVPIRAKIDPEQFMERARNRLAELESAVLTRDSMVDDKAQLHALDDIHETTGDMIPPGIALEHRLHPVQAFLILPLFALFNAGVYLGGDALGQTTDPIAVGIILGLVLGKQIGVVGFSWISIKSGLADLPDGVSWPHIWGASCLAGVGFTMSLFIAELAFDDPIQIGKAKLGILEASLVAGALGYWILSRSLPKATKSTID